MPNSDSRHVMRHHADQQRDLDKLCEMAEASPGGMSPLFLTILEQVRIRQQEEITPECARCQDH